MLAISNLHVAIEDKPILRGLDLNIAAGEVHAVMGPNGSGKSTLAHVLAGREGYQISAGEVLFEGADLLALEPEQRAHKGVFLGMQYPVELPGVNNMMFMRESVNAVRRGRGEPELDTVTFISQVRKQASLLELDETLLKRNVNAGFSGGEKKRNEILQMAMLEPKLAILDETDSGLDIDALRVIAGGVNALRSPQRSILLITHYQRLLDYIQPDYVHVLVAGRIVRSGDRQLALELEDKGYGWITGEAAA
jgi:Fe-S cluster assembly ATP-binding protein